MLNVLVTGGAGFIGSNFIEYLLEAKDDVRVINLDKLTYAGNLENLKNVEKNLRYEFVRGDICDSSLVNQIFEKSSIRLFTLQRNLMLIGALQILQPLFRRMF
jgi:dTDP-glucose 4,6-dehydratase